METIRNKINNRTSFDLFEYANKYIEQLYKDGKHATYKKYKSVVKKLRFYVGNDSLPIKSISLDFIKGYENYLMNHIGNNRNTTTVNLKALAKLVGDIYRNYDMDETGNPFRKMRFKREQTDRTFLEIEEIHKIQHLKLRARNPLYDAREVFLFECYTGIRISDILTLKWKHITDEKISIRMRKTEKLLTIPINDYVRSVLDRRRCAVENNGGKITSEKYVFNILKVDVDEVSAQDALNAISSATAVINKQLKKIAEQANIDKAFACNMRKSNQIAKYDDVEIYLLFGKNACSTSLWIELYRHLDRWRIIAECTPIGGHERLLHHLNDGFFRDTSLCCNLRDGCIEVAFHRSMAHSNAMYIT